MGEFVMNNLALVALFVASGVMLFWPEIMKLAGAGGQEIGTLEATRLMNQGSTLVLDVRDQLRRLLRPNPPAPSPAREGGGKAPPLAGEGLGRGSDTTLLRCVFAAYPDRLARRREPGSTRALTVGGRVPGRRLTSRAAEAAAFAAAVADRVWPSRPAARSAAAGSRPL